MINPIMYVILSFVPAGILAMAFELWHKWHTHIGGDPVSFRLLRSPGETCRKQAEELSFRIWEIYIWIFGFPATLMAIYLSHTGTKGLIHPLSGFSIAALIVASAVSVFFVSRVISLIKSRSNWRLSFKGERAVGEQLNQLMCDGCRVFHDFPISDSRNIDHIVIAPSGVYAIETRVKRKHAPSGKQLAHEVIYNGQSLEYPFHSDRQDIMESLAQAARLSKFFAATVEESLPVKPILTLPGWYVIHRGVGDVMVLNPRMIEAAILAPTPNALSAEQIRKVARVLDQKCRDVEF